MLCDYLFLTADNQRTIKVQTGIASGKPEKYLTGLADLFPAYSENKPIKNGDHGFKPY